MLKKLLDLPWWLWRRHCRKLDMDILWPIIKKQAQTLDEARRAFYFHIYSDPVWYTDYSAQDLHDFVLQLK